MFKKIPDKYYSDDRRYEGLGATFDLDDTKKIAQVIRKLEKILDSTNYNNRDTQMLESGIEQLETIYKLQFTYKAFRFKQLIR